MDENTKRLVGQINKKSPHFLGSIRAAGGEGDEPKRYEISVSSETPYERWFGIEVLGHKDGEVDLSWLGGGNAPLLLQHDHNKVLGVVENAKLEGGRVTATVRFGRSALAQEIAQDIDDGIRTNISVGYRVDELVLVSKGKDGPDTYRVTRWMPYEASSVSVPADMSVGTNRAGDGEGETTIEIRKEPKMDKQKELARSLGLNEDASIDSIMEAQSRKAKAEAKAEADAELRRINEIRAQAAAHRDRIADIDQRAERAVKDSISLESFRREILDCYVDGTAKLASAPAHSKQERRDIGRFSLAKAIREMADHRLTGVEAEVHAEGVKELKDLGRSAGGFAIPHSMLQRDVTVAGEGTDLVQTTIQDFIGLLHNKMIVRQLGARYLGGLSGNVQIPRMTAGATAAWEGEDDAGSEQTQTFGQLALSPHRIGCYTELSKQLVVQSTPDVNRIIQDDLATAIALAIDLAAIHGTGANDQPTGIVATAGIGSVVGGAAGAAPDWADIVDLETAVATANADIGSLAYLTNAKVRGKLKKTAIEAGDAAKVWQNGSTPLNGYPAGVSNQVSSTLTKGGSVAVCSAILFGNWSDLIIAGWGGLDIVVDPYSLATTNLLRVTINTYADIGVRQAGSFAAMLDALTA
jgi:HK97 family phage major capsid protein